MFDPVSGTTVAAGGLMGASMFGFATGLSRRCIAPVFPLQYRRVLLVYSIPTSYLEVAVIRTWLISCVENLLSRFKLTCLQ